MEAPPLIESSMPDAEPAFACDGIGYLCGLRPVLPARFARLAGGTAIILLPPPALATMTATTTGPKTTASTAFRFRPCFVYRQCPSLKILAIKGRNGLGCVFILGHFDKAKSAGFPGVTVCHDLHLLDFSELSEKCSKRVFC